MSKDDKQAEPITGSDVIRERLRIWAHHGHLASLANDINTPVNGLEAFIQTGVKPSADTLKALTREVLSHAVYDPSADLLRPAAKRASTPLGVAPAPYTARADAYPPTTKPRPGAPPLFDPATRKRTPKPTRPGWAE